jgi:hypothetical protein
MMYDFYVGNEDLRINEYEVQSRDEADMFNFVECPSGLGFWCSYALVPNTVMKLTTQLMTILKTKQINRGKSYFK